MRGWGWIVVVGLLGCVDPFPEIGGSQQVDADARPADAAPPDAQPDRPVEPPVDLGVDATPDMAACQPAEEICNGVDDDCDGNHDERLPRQACPLTEGVCAGVTTSCLNGMFGTCNYGFASDDYEVEETRCDGLDNDCDGDIDEGCGCEPGAEQACGRDEGVCQAGVQICGDNAMFGPCVGAIEGGQEICNGLDDDCDGTPDEEADVACETGQPGVCAPGDGRCVEGALVCQPVAMPMDEVCNGLDDDCDGTPDEGLDGAECRTDLDGECSEGRTRCVAGALRCEPIAPPAAEACNGQDDDCDGVVDELPPDPCDSGELGQCAGGRQQCVDGNLFCAPIVGPMAERCDSTDNDCDGIVDESIVPEPCALADAACGMGTTRCVDGVELCEGAGNAPDLCDGIDTDCDDRIDEDAVMGQRCETGDPRCVEGAQRCVAGEVICEIRPLGIDDRGPDDVDDDCDGVVDEDRLTLYIEDLMMGGEGRRPGRDPGFIPGFARVEYGAGPIPPDSPEPFIDRVFRPNHESPDGRGAQISSSGLRYDFSSDVGSDRTWTPPAKGPVEYLDNDANVPPVPGTFIIELHANLGITFDLQVVRDRYPNRRLTRLRGRVGSRARGDTQMEVLLDGESVYKSNCIDRESRNRSTLENIPQQLLGGRRFLTFVAMDCNNNDIDERHGFFYDARLELEPIGEVQAEP